MWDGLQIVKQVLDAGATVRVPDFPSLDLTTPEGRGFLALFSAMAERERMRIRLRIVADHPGEQSKHWRQRCANQRGFAASKTPGGGGIESGTKKSGASSILLSI
jgi:hypothetical protein